MDREAASSAIEAFLKALGYAPEGDLAETGRLVAQAWADDLLDGAGVDPVGLLSSGAVPSRETDRSGLVVMRDLDVMTMCPHHLMPALGRGDVIYRPGDEVAGFGAVVRALRACTRRLTLQERAGAMMCHALLEGLGARGALCRLRMKHSCLAARGAREARVEVETLALDGDFAEDPASRQLALDVLRGGG